MEEEKDRWRERLRYDRTAAVQRSVDGGSKPVRMMMMMAERDTCEHEVYKLMTVKTKTLKSKEQDSNVPDVIIKGLVVTSLITDFIH